MILTWIFKSLKRCDKMEDKIQSVEAEEVRTGRTGGNTFGYLIIESKFKPFLPMPGPGKTINVMPIDKINTIQIKCKKCGSIDHIKYIPVVLLDPTKCNEPYPSFVYRWRINKSKLEKLKTMLKQYFDNKLPFIHDDLSCIIGLPIVIKGILWESAPTTHWRPGKDGFMTPPIIYDTYIEQPTSCDDGFSLLTTF